LLVLDKKTGHSRCEFNHVSPFGAQASGPSRALTSVSDPVELLDLFPTLVDLCGLPHIPKCPRNSSHITLCTQGHSLISHFNDSSDTNGISFAFSQYPRPSLEPCFNSDAPRLKAIKYMGYSLRSRGYRYTEWVRFDTSAFRPVWNEVAAAELYDRDSDPDENENVAGKRRYRKVQRTLRKILRRQHEFNYFLPDE
jgi:iduronate 2-sulfatase